MNAYKKMQFSDELTLTALQVMHDISSPVAVLDLIQDKLIAPDENKILLKNAITQIRNISSAFIEKTKQEFLNKNHIESTPCMLYSLLEQVVNEKRLQFQNNVEIIFKSESNSNHVFSYLDPLEFNRTLSNLINNSVEAITDNNSIAIFLSYIEDKALIQIQDYGKGIAASALPRIGELGFSVGKKQGTGVGLYQAINFVKKCGGRVEINTQEGNGTVIKIFLPCFLVE